MKMPSLKRLNKVDFAKTDQALIDKLSYIFNIDFLNVYQALTRNLDFNNNFNANILTISVSVDSIGKPKASTTLTTTITGQVAGMVVLNAVNTTNSTTYPTSAPFISFSNSASGNITINNITGLPSGDTFTLTVLALGS